jgi:hypothetical protein
MKQVGMRPVNLKPHAVPDVQPSKQKQHYDVTAQHNITAQHDITP